MRFEKTIKCCTYCHRGYHTEDEYHDKFPHLCTNSSNNNSKNGKTNLNGKCKYQRTNTSGNNSTLRDKNDNASYFTIPLEMECFMATSTSSSLKLLSTWI